MHQKCWETFLEQLFHLVGVVLNDVKIRKLCTSVDGLASNTTGALSAVNFELVAISSLVLQNRLALDILFAKEAGVCCVLRVQQCCTYIPDKSSEVDGYIRNISSFSRC